MRATSKIFGILLSVLFFLFCPYSILKAQSSKIKTHSVKPALEIPNPEEENWELGLRAGIGYKGEDRLNSFLRGFTNTYDPGVASKTELDPPKQTTQVELFIRKRIASESQIGFIGGYREWQKFGLKQFSSEPFYTDLKFKISNPYALLMYWHEWNYKRWIFQGGLGAGMSQVYWDSEGYATSGKETFRQEGSLSGTGIEFRLEGAVSRRITESASIQLGIAFSWINIPSLSGTFNGESASFYLRENGNITPLTESDNQTSMLVTNQFSRKLEFQVLTTTLFFGIAQKF
ncbi:hypothetical protein J9305_10720 [Leptospira interrogans]|uniref:LIC_11366 family protein n=1 Tax=Leptospira interrogans TaxID=173 RepID=UPI0002783C80|nr:hypothetical protein [Leptospira interrogans]EJP03169.1 hypothetical protein LEP1GSC007_2262 [Leptospira interrogans serovar Bulgarica str. Mallika]EKR28301.1 hypothetical protein LEP1GSC087_3358 [Leptospira interrogans serovar Bataviae str. L1111]EKR36612.1 hypothetical protein LEP1GSC096_0410 [Leptospira interrogans serovar Hebdomadis str. R499]UID82243.1 hypothetical protein J9305_10720 [Leptospira interrogans]